MTKRSTAEIHESDDGKVTVITPTVQQPAVVPPDSGSALFDFGDDSEHKVATIGVYRREPMEEEGYLGRVSGDATEADIFQRFGGGTFQIHAYNDKGRVMKQQRLQVAGDPKFKSEHAKRKWLQSQAAGTMATEAEMPVQILGAAPTSGMDSIERALALLMPMFSAQQEASREAIREREREAVAREERLRREQEAADERRRRDYEEARQRDRDHQVAMLQMLTAKQDGGADSMAMLLKGIELARTLGPGGGGDDDDDGEDAVAVAVKSFAQGLISGKRPDAAPAAQPNPTPKPGVRVHGPIANKLREFQRVAQASGRDPDAVLSEALDALNTELPKQAKKAIPAPAAPTSAAEPARKAPPKRATVKR
jgi:hypothetical protein